MLHLSGQSWSGSEFNGPKVHRLKDVLALLAEFHRSFDGMGRLKGHLDLLFGVNGPKTSGNIQYLEYSRQPQ